MGYLHQKIEDGAYEPRGYLMNYPKGQDTWSDTKKMTYETNLLRVFGDVKYNDYLECFTFMVKTGEVNTTISMEHDPDGYLTGQKSRPRAIMNPTKGALGLMQAIQTEIFPLLKDCLPGFIHSMTSKEIVSLISSRIKAFWKAISLDGSAFDSS